MIRYLPYQDIDKDKWDKCIASSPDGQAYAFSWYLDIVSPYWEALVKDDYHSVFPLTRRRKAGIHYLYQPHFTQQLGVYSVEESSADEVKEFVEAIPLKFKLIEIQLNCGNRLASFDGFRVYERITHHLELSDTAEKIVSNYSENIQRNIKKTAKANLKVSQHVVPVDIVDLFRKNRGAAIRTLKGEDYEVLLSLLDTAHEHNRLDCRGVFNDSNRLIAGAAFLKSVHSYVFLFSAAGHEARETGSMSAIIDSFIREHSNEKCYLDFEGSMDINLARFYKSFGSKEVVYLQIRKKNLPLLIRWLK